MGTPLADSLTSALDRLRQSERKGGQWCVNLSAPKDPAIWMQVLSDCVNLWYPYDTDPLERVRAAGLDPDGRLELLGWEPRQYATLGYPGGVEAGAAFVHGLMTKVLGFSEDTALGVEMEQLD